MTVSEKELEHYRSFYPEYTEESLKRALCGVKRVYGKLDAVTVAYYMRPQRFGGLGYRKKIQADKRGD